MRRHWTFGGLHFFDSPPTPKQPALPVASPRIAFGEPNGIDVRRVNRTQPVGLPAARDPSSGMGSLDLDRDQRHRAGRGRLCGFRADRYLSMAADLDQSTGEALAGLFRPVVAMLVGSGRPTVALAEVVSRRIIYSSALVSGGWNWPILQPVAAGGAPRSHSR